MMLKCINPGEASFLDSASGIHIKYRLAGVSFPSQSWQSSEKNRVFIRAYIKLIIVLVCKQEKFPPNIYYKIFTHRPVQDMCANSPKDYTAACEKLSMGRDIHNVKPTVVSNGAFKQYNNNHIDSMLMGLIEILGFS